MISKIEKHIDNSVSDVGPCKMPGTPNYDILQPKRYDEQIWDEDQGIYRSGVGGPLYLGKLQKQYKDC
jgi:hypothetical protein